MAGDIKRINSSLEFLTALFAKKPADAFVLCWTLPNRKSYWYQELNAAAQSIVNWNDREAYVGAGLSGKDYGPNQRCKAEDIIGVTATWADIDYASAVHTKKGLPPDEETARQIIQTVEIPYSLLINSGHGLQAWWLLEHPWIFVNEDDKRAAQEFMYRWSDTIRARAHALGYDADSTPDLARVMRLVGTINNKDKANPKTVTMLEHYPNRVYTQQDFLPYMVDPRLRTFARPDSRPSGSLRLRADASPPFDKWEALRTAEPRAQQSWDRKRKDFRDQSPSAYDYSLASFAIMAGWADQEICDLLIASRRMHGDDLKLRESYYQMTVQKARKSIEQSKAQEALDELVITRVEEKIEHAPAPAEDEPEINKRSAILQNLSVQLGIKILRIIRMPSSEPQFKIELEDVTVMLGPVENLTSQTRLRNCIARDALKYIRKFKTGEWDRISEALFSAVEDVDIGIDATERGMVRVWLERYLSERPIYTDLSAAAEQYYPFEKGGDIYIFGTDLREWLNLRHENLSMRKMAESLQHFGANPEVINVEVNRRRTTRGVWRLPPEMAYLLYQEQEEGKVSNLYQL